MENHLEQQNIDAVDESIVGEVSFFRERRQQRAKDEEEESQTALGNSKASTRQMDDDFLSDEDGDLTNVAPTTTRGRGRGRGRGTTARSKAATKQSASSVTFHDMSDDDVPEEPPKARGRGRGGGRGSRARGTKAKTPVVSTSSRNTARNSQQRSITSYGRKGIQFSDSEDDMEY